MFERHNSRPCTPHLLTPYAPTPHARPRQFAGVLKKVASKECPVPKLDESFTCQVDRKSGEGGVGRERESEGRRGKEREETHIPTYCKRELHVPVSRPWMVWQLWQARRRVPARCLLYSYAAPYPLPAPTSLPSPTHPQPSILNPQPSTLNSQPFAQQGHGRQRRRGCLASPCLLQKIII
jgi:hypothetical protein